MSASEGARRAGVVDKSIDIPLAGIVEDEAVFNPVHYITGECR